MKSTMSWRRLHEKTNIPLSTLQYRYRKYKNYLKEQGGKIDPFYDGNGRTGRLLMMKQCLENNIVPFWIDEFSKMFYYQGLKEWNQYGKDERLINVFLSAQDTMETTLQYFQIDYERKETTYKDVIAHAKKK